MIETDYWKPYSLQFPPIIFNISLGIKNAGDTALLVLFVLFGTASLICVFHSPRQVLVKYIFLRNLKFYDIIMCL